MLRLAAVLALCAAPVCAQTPQCAPLPDMAATLAAKHGERLKIMLRAPTGVIAIFANPDSGTWTLVASGPVQTCIMAFGHQRGDRGGRGGRVRFCGTPDR